MAIGVSTSCFYPMHTEDALRTLGELGVRCCEVFLNSYSETSISFAETLRGIADRYGMRIVSVHPFCSFAESYMLFGEYDRRLQDGLDFYRRNFEVTAALGAGISVIHGDKLPSKITDEQYLERFHALVNAGKPFGITVAQENVNRFRSQDPAFLRRMRTALGDDFYMVFDVKQAVRVGYDPLPFFREFADRVVHLHVSDHLPGRDCVAPGTGTFDFSALRAATAETGCHADWIVELYRAGFGAPEELAQAVRYLETLR